MRAVAWMALVTAGCGLQASNQLEADAPRVLAIEISPANVRVGRYETTQLRATAILADHTRVDATDTVDWATTTPGIASISDGGLIVANNLGSVAVTAALGPLTATSGFEVTDAALVGMFADREEAHPQSGAPVVISVTLGWSDGRSSDGGAQVQWSGPVESVDGALFATDSGAAVAAYRDRSVTVEVITDAGDAAMFLDDASAYHIQDAYALALPLRNPSLFDTPGFFVDLWVDDPDAERSSLAPSSRWIPTLPADTERTLYLPFVVVEPEEDDESAIAHTVAVFVDPSDDVGGEQPAIDLRLAALVDGDASAAPELATIEAHAHLSADVFWYHLVVENQSAQDARGFYVDAWLNTPQSPRLGSIGDIWVRVDALAAGERIAVDLMAPWTPGDCAMCTSWVRVDTLDDVNERDGANTWGPVVLEREEPEG